MKIVDVIPVAKGVFKEQLSYFSSKNILPGSLLLVPLRNKLVPAVANSVFDAKESKISIKESSLTLKPVKKIISESFVTPEFLESCKETAEYFVSTPGTVLKDFAPQTLFESGSGFLPGQAGQAGNAATARRYETTLLRAPQEERIQYYRSVIREEFAKNRSVFFLLPAVSGMEEIFAELKRGIESYAFALHGKLPKKKMIDKWRKAATERHPVLIAATKKFLSLPRTDIGAIIVEQENSPVYKSQKRPYIDFRKAAEIISKKIKARLIFGDDFPRSETFHRQETGEFGPPPAPISRVVSEAEQIIIDAKKEAKEKRPGGKISATTAALRNLVSESVRNSEKIIIFSNRRGYSPTTICVDCQRTILCGKCETPLVLHKDSGKKETNANIHVCHKCLHKSPAPEKCPYCQSWRLETYGFGTQMIAEELAGLFPDAKIFRMDSDSASTGKKAEGVARAFLSSSGSILVGTEMIFSHIKTGVENVAVVSLDGLFTLPEFRINERVFQMLLRLKSLARKKFLVQTRFFDHPIFQHVLKGNIVGFYKEELENRKRFQYPPFKLLIKITKESKDDAKLAGEFAALEKILAEWHPAGYKAFIPKIKNVYRRHILLKLEAGTWPEKQKKLHAVLSSLPPSCKIDVEPETLL